jgi:4-amino-4-deoxy-L-arabinose transferase-like glycosyltransferase
MMLKSEKTYVYYSVYFLLALLIFVLVYNIFLPAHPDEAYYWQWGRHLALSYYDGPPLTAYLLRMTTLLFGSSAFTIKLVGVLLSYLILITSFFFAKHLFNAKTAFISIVIFSLLPIFQSALVITTLDQGLILFWILSLYTFYLALHENKYYCYLTGLCLGLSMLAKYPGILLLPSFFLYLMLTKKFREFTNIHWYLSALLAAIIFSPVILWNWHHQWASFAFQYHHGVAAVKHFQWQDIGNFLGGQMGVSNPLFFCAIFIIILVNRKEIFQNDKLLLLLIPFLFTFFFFFYNGIFKKTEANWPAPSYVSIVILVSYFIQRYDKKRLFFLITVSNLVFLVLIRFPSATPFLPHRSILLTKFLGYKSMAQQAAPVYLKYYRTNIVVSDSYADASELALYLPSQPETYILGGKQNQYYYWTLAIQARIHAGKIKSALYIGNESGIAILHKYFKNIIFIKMLNYHGRWNNRHWVIYRAWN